MKVEQDLKRRDTTLSSDENPVIRLDGTTVPCSRLETTGGDGWDSAEPATPGNAGESAAGAEGGSAGGAAAGAEGGSAGGAAAGAEGGSAGGAAAGAEGGSAGGAAAGADAGVRELSTDEPQRVHRDFVVEMVKLTRDELRNHAVPLILLGVLLMFPPLLLFWVPCVLLWWGCEAAYSRMSPLRRKQIRNLLPESWRESRVWREFADGLAQVRPFILISLYVSCIPLALIWMFAHWSLRLFRKDVDQRAHTQCDQTESVSFLQNRRQIDEEAEENFFHSPAFSVTCVALFVSGLPAAFTYLLYHQLGIDALVGFPSMEAAFFTKFAVFGLYLASVGWCLSVLFFRSWFTFPLNFLGGEQTIELNEWGVRRSNHSWFTQAVTLNTPWAGAHSLAWPDIKALRIDRTAAPLYPLPKNVFPGNSFLYNFLNKLAFLMDGVSGCRNREEFAYFTTNPELGPAGGQMASTIRLRLSELNGEERARLFYAIRTWAPHVVIDESVQEKIIGSASLQAPRYTQLWFELLTDSMPKQRYGILPPGAELRGGALVVKERLSSGGQANVYLAARPDGSEVVLKEFILSTSDAVGALVESAGDFETEATLLSELSHPRIICMEEFFAEDRRLYIVLEKVDGASLRQLIRKREEPLDEDEVVRIALGICEALEYLHSQNPPVVHRDIAPDNVLMSSSGEIKVIDFSLAAAKKSRRTTSTMGKHSYAPAEQLQDRPCPASDIYALGATMYFLLTGEDPKPITPSNAAARRPEVSQRLNEIILRATAYSLEDRYDDIRWVKMDLQALLCCIK